MVLSKYCKSGLGGGNAPLSQIVASAFDVALRQVGALLLSQSKGRALENLLITSRIPAAGLQKASHLSHQSDAGTLVLDADQLDHAAQGLASGNRAAGHSQAQRLKLGVSARQKSRIAPPSRRRSLSCPRSP